jgi:hypothetical protein
MKNLPVPIQLSVSCLLLMAMIATRFHHFGDLLHLPDASMAVFFLGGLYLRRHLGFAVFLLVAVAIDYFAITGRGLNFFDHYCVTPSYAFLLLAYAVLWYAGRWYAPRMPAGWRGFARAFGVAFVAAAGSFLISNGAFYWLGGRYAEPNLAEYLSRVWRWGPLFVRTSLSYVAVALVAHAAIARIARPPAAQPSAHR